jgi:malto-oligosyltrehalose synthase/4-alpha-glucanotransferase
MFNPVSTYRIQFHQGFTFNDFEQVIPYLERLGVSTIYASPIFEAIKGSMHGYDGINPLRINPELGTLQQLKRISRKLKSKGISWIQDIVPNHMAYHPDNLWLRDVLEHGPKSKYKNYFDQSLSDDFFSGSIMAPFLDAGLNEVIDKGELIIEKVNKKLIFNYAGNHWPLRRDSYPDKSLSLLALNADKEMLKRIAGQQYYRLCSWRETDQQINFRRFFTVNGLIGLNVQNQEVFDRFHGLINALLKEDIIQGLRIDHIDGLYDPAEYLKRLRRLTGSEAYIIVEKILEPGEQMENWPIQGSTGYDFLAMVNNLLTNVKSEKAFTAFYQKIIDSTTPITEQIARKKTYILQRQMQGELDNLIRFFLESKVIDGDSLQAATAADMKEAIAQLLIRCPVYRYYGNDLPLNKREGKVVKDIFKLILLDKPELKQAIKLLQQAWFGKNVTPQGLRFYQRCMQLTGPLMAKGVEDTLMYTYNRFIAHNEVGDAPEPFGIATADFHKKMISRQKKWPLSMNGTSTHDTKRGEGARARLNVLTDIAEEWFQAVSSWQEINHGLKRDGAPDANDEYFIYETLCGTYPMPGEGADDYPERITQYLQKTIREAKLHSGWSKPNLDYETSVTQFTQKLLDKKGAFWKSFEKFHQKIVTFGIINSLAQALLKLSAPGIPDMYQGCELWDLSLVDPDNRRPVDFELRDKLLQDILKRNDIQTLWKNRFNGQIKLWLHHILLHERKNNPLVFEKGKYLPLQTAGKFKDHIIALARHHKHTWYIIAVPLNMATVCPDPMRFDWEDTCILLPENAPDEFENVLLKTPVKTGKVLAASLLFKELPLVVLNSAMPENKRGSGILMHITSLPSAFGTGDFGPGAKAFAGLLHSSCQKYWQLLPLGPVSEKNQFSPYSSWSAMGGNTLLISPELLREEGLLTEEDLKKYEEQSKAEADYKTSAWLKAILFDIAWSNYQKGNCPWLKAPFHKFCKTEAHWLNHFAVYAVLKEKYNGAPWYQWPAKYKLRNKKACDIFVKEHFILIEKAKWLQFIFTGQWQRLKHYCNRLNIQLIGDLPFYVNYDAVDVWAHPEIFNLDSQGQMQAVAGVPPDYFNSEGQRWGMPVFRWDRLKEQNYAWWVQRVRKNKELFDWIRLDHFRAFSTYWAIPPGEETAVNGCWEKGPGIDLFQVLKKELGHLPFIAEDLGDIDDAVYQLRDKLAFPGMKVLQFAFGKDLPGSPHILHHHKENSIVYTGTHDNNTSKGWFSRDADKEIIDHLNKYTGKTISRKNVASELIKMALSSVAKITIIPLQDLLDLDESGRMNMPAATQGNWLWRITPKAFKQINSKRLKKWTERYDRI